MNIFISYRRDDSSVHARLLYKELLGYFDADDVFMDIQDIGYGDDFAGLINQHLEQAEVVLVVIGPRWVELVEQRLRGDDWVRHEVERALVLRGAKQLRVLPVFVGGAGWEPTRLPPGLAALQKLNALSLADRRFDEDLRTVVEAIRRRRIWDDLVDAVRGRRARLSGIAIGMLTFAAGWVALFDHVGIDSRLATASMGLASIGQTPTWSGQLVLVTIDERSEAAIGRAFDSSWRAEHARLIDRAMQARARAVVFDLVLGHAATPAANEALQAAAIRAKGQMPVIFGAHGRSSPNAPVQVLSEQVTTAIACAGRKLGLARSLPLAVHRASDQALLPSLALAAVSGGGRIDAVDETRQRISVRGPQDRLLQASYFAAETVRNPQPDCPAIQPGDRVLLQLIDASKLPALVSSAPRIAYQRVWGGEPAALAELSGRIVLVGVTRRGEDILELPAAAPRWGVELIAVQIDSLLRGQAIRSAGPMLQSLVSVGMGLAGAMIVIARHRRGWRWALPLLLIGAALLFWIAVLAWYRIELQLISLPYGWAALVLGALAARHILKGKSP